MPADAKPIPWPQPLPGTVTYRRTYFDPLGRAMRGKVKITPVPKTPPTEEEKKATKSSPPQAVVVARVAVTVDLNGGILEVDLPPDTYSLTAELRTVDGDKATDTDEIVLS